MKNLTREKYLKFVESSKALRELEAKKAVLMEKMEVAFHQEALKQGFITELEAYEAGLISPWEAYQKKIITRSEARKKDRSIW